MIAGLLLVVLAGENASKPGEFTLERPTFICLGVPWVIQGDDNRNASVDFKYRKAGAEEWRQALPLFRVEKGVSRKRIPRGAWLFAGSVFDLQEGTEYELKLTLNDPDGADAGKTLRARTRKEPFAPPSMRIRHVVPGSGGGSGTRESPFKGLEAANRAAQPGDLFLVHKGVYPATWTANKSGTPEKPIVWRGAGDGEAAIDGALAPKRPGRGISGGDIHDVFFERLTIRNVDYGIVLHRSKRIVVRRCNIHGVEYGITWTNNRPLTEDITVTDCTMQGPSTWPRTRGIENARGIQASGTGHVCMYNRVKGFADGIDTFGSDECSAIDFYGNDISEMTDDGIEMDYSQHNTRCFRNRFTNVFQGITTQPIYGGPVYIFRNAMYNVGLEVYKMHNDPSGALLFHNTSVKAGMANVLYSRRVRNFVQRNNIFIGTTANYCYESTARMVDCDFDYDAYGGGPWGNFCKWNGKIYRTLADVQKTGLFQTHGILLTPANAFASGLLPPKDARAQQFPVTVNDLRIKPECEAVDKGVLLPNINDGFTGKAPDIGCYELGQPLPHYGPRPEKPRVVPKKDTPASRKGRPPAEDIPPEIQAVLDKALASLRGGDLRAARSQAAELKARPGLPAAAVERADAIISAIDAYSTLKAELIRRINSGISRRVQVDYLGMPARGKAVGASEAGMVVDIGGEAVTIAWDDLSIQQFVSAVKAYRTDDDTDQTLPLSALETLISED